MNPIWDRNFREKNTMFRLDTETFGGPFAIFFVWEIESFCKENSLALVCLWLSEGEKKFQTIYFF